MLHLKPFGKSFNQEFIKSPFTQTVKIKAVIGNIDFDFTEKSQYFIGKHIRNDHFQRIDHIQILPKTKSFRKKALRNFVIGNGS